MKISIIITTCIAENWLRKVFIEFSVQTEIDFEIADDDSISKIKSLNIFKR